MLKIRFIIVFICIFFVMQAAFAADYWVGTWATGLQLTETNNNPPSPGLSNNTLRQVVHATISGSQLRVEFSNAYGNGPLTINAAHLAASTGSTASSAINTATDKTLTFKNATSVTIAAGQSVYSDTVSFSLAALSNVAVTIYFGSVPSNITGHPSSRTTSYLQTGNAVTAASMTSAVATEHWYVISGIDVLTDQAYAAVVTLGDSITDGRGSTANANNRWPDGLATRLQANTDTNRNAVLNMGIGGNAVVSGGLGPTALTRFEHDVLTQDGVRWLIILEGVNDIGSAGSEAVATNLTNAYQQMIDKAHAKNVLVYGVPILPIGGSQYDSTIHESARKTVNNWIRTSGRFDAVLDLEAIVRDPAKPTYLLAAYDSGDHLHLSAAGYQKMADAINLTLFKNSVITTPTPTSTPTSIPTPTPQQSPVWTGGPYSFDGVSNYVNVPDGITSNLRDFSVACWVNLNAVTNWVRIFDFGGDANVFMMLTPSAGSTGFPYFAITTSGNAGEQGLNGTSVLPIGSWQHLAVVKSGNTGILYVNSLEVARNNSMTLNPTDLGLTSNNYLGRSQWSNDPYLNGSLDRFSFFNRAINATEITALYADKPGQIKRGDVNGDGSVTIVDAMLVAQYAAGLNPVGFKSANADVNCDNSININDALLIARYSAGLMTSMPCPN